MPGVTTGDARLTEISWTMILSELGTTTRVNSAQLIEDSSEEWFELEFDTTGALIGVRSIEDISGEWSEPDGDAASVSSLEERWYKLSEDR